MDVREGDQRLWEGDERMMDEVPPSPWELQRAINRADEDRRQDVARLEAMHNADRSELLGYLDALGARLERTIRETAGVPAATWELHNRSVDRELAELRTQMEGLRRVVVGTLLTMIAGGLAVAGVEVVSRGV